MPSQIDLDITYLKMADEWAQLSKAVRRKVGCLIVKDSQIISDVKAISEGFTLRRNSGLVAKAPKRMKNEGVLNPR